MITLTLLFSVVLFNVCTFENVKLKLIKQLLQIDLELFILPSASTFDPFEDKLLQVVGLNRLY